MKATSLCTYGGWDSITGVLPTVDARDLVSGLEALRPEIMYRFYEPMGDYPEGEDYVYLTVTMPKAQNPELREINILLDSYRDKGELSPGLPAVMLYTTTTSNPGVHDNAERRTIAPIPPFRAPGMNDKGH